MYRFYRLLNLGKQGHLFIDRPQIRFLINGCIITSSLVGLSPLNFIERFEGEYSQLNVVQLLFTEGYILFISLREQT